MENVFAREPDHIYLLIKMLMQQTESEATILTTVKVNTLNTPTPTMSTIQTTATSAGGTASHHSSIVEATKKVVARRRASSFERGISRIRAMRAKWSRDFERTLSTIEEGDEPSSLAPAKLESECQVSESASVEAIEDGEIRIADTVDESRRRAKQVARALKKLESKLDGSYWAATGARTSRRQRR